MSRRAIALRRRWLIASACAWSAMAAAGVHRPWSMAGSVGQQGARPMVDALRQAARPGDLLFRGTRSLEGQVVRWYDGASDFTHVGVVVASAGAALEVVHASPDVHRVTADPLETFLQTEGIHAAGLYRWLGADDRSLTQLQSDALASVGRRFDGAFDSADAAELYCTELVWMLARQRGWVDRPALKTLRTPLGPRHVITVEALLQQLPLQPVWQQGADGVKVFHV